MNPCTLERRPRKYGARIEQENGTGESLAGNKCEGIE